MKKTMKFMAMLLCAAMAFGLTSCNREEDGDLSSGEWVDLGLPSGLLWASCNIGANSPEEYGDYYAWGETQTKTNYSWGTYIWCNGSSTKLTKYCNKSSNGYNGFTDHLMTLESSDDVATATLGNGARIPTKKECQELLNNTTPVWTSQNGVYGRKFTAANGNSIFLPAAGFRKYSELYDAGAYGRYWSSLLETADYPESAFGIRFNSGDQYVAFDDRYYGRPVRAVRASQN